MKSFPAYKETRNRFFFAHGGGFRGPTNWYRSRFHHHLGLDQEATDLSTGKISEKIPKHIRTLFIEQNHKSVVTMPMVTERMSLYAEGCVLRQVSTVGHWVQLESADEVNGFLEEFLEKKRG